MTREGARVVGKETFELARVGSPAEIAEYLTSLAAWLERGDVALESRQRTLRLTPAAEVKLALVVKDRDDKGKISIEIAWKRRSAAATDLKGRAGSRGQSV